MNVRRTLFRTLKCEKALTSNFDEKVAERSKNVGGEALDDVVGRWWSSENAEGRGEFLTWQKIATFSLRPSTSWGNAR